MIVTEHPYQHLRSVYKSIERGGMRERGRAPQATTAHYYLPGQQNRKTNIFVKKLYFKWFIKVKGWLYKDLCILYSTYCNDYKGGGFD